MCPALSHTGLSLYNAEISCSPAAGGGKKKRRGARAHRSAFLFTHRGYSGPSVLDLSHSITMALERGQPLPGAPAPLISSVIAPVHATPWQPNIDMCCWHAGQALPKACRLSGLEGNRSCKESASP